MYIELEISSDEESRKSGARIAFDYRKINHPPKFDLTLDSDRDQEGNNSKHESDEPEFCLYEKLNMAVESLTLTPLSVDRVSGIISDNGFTFKYTKIHNFANCHDIDWRYLTIYYPRANRLDEAVNKTLIQIIKKTLNDNKCQWDESLVEALWAYWTTFGTLTQSTLFALVYGSEAVLPLEVQIPSLIIAIQNQITTQQNSQLHLEELEGLEGRRLQAQQNLELYKARMIQAHDKLMRPRTFQVDDLVLVLRRPILVHRKIGGKFEPTWEGPFIVKTVYEGGSYQLVDCKENHPMHPVNVRFLKKYYT
ncbi:uncharacterized protein LOC110098239 [Dendrobium catenatum]|uniref:uncharacterized protein LOC110098239 n=1 Tax=Dendrobium catenatum TaxID=906689 RepID=UPI0009F4E26F|nr:uncharacterized protein LOC110098239 [Dendrobium catenatum]